MKDVAPDLAPDRSTALLVVDMQEGFANGVEPARVLAGRIAEFIDAVGDGYALVTASRFRNEPGSLYDRIVADDMHDPSQVELLAPIRGRIQHVVDSCTYSSLTTELRDQFASREIRRVHVCGIDSDQCVLATVLAAFDHGIEPMVLADLCLSTSGDECHAAGLLALRRAIGEQRVVASSRVAEQARTTGGAR